MNYKTVLVAAGVLAVASAIVYRLRTGNSVEIETGRASAEHSVAAVTEPVGTSATDAAVENSALTAPASASATPTAPTPASVPKAARIDASVDPQARELLAAVRAAYSSTLSAFDPTGEDHSDFDARDAKAAEDAEALARTFDFAHSTLPTPLRPVCQELVEHVTAAQLQIMAFAINRKNRGLPDSAQAEAEGEDRKQFKRDVEPLFSQLASALG